VQFESPHSVDENQSSGAAVTGPFSFMKGKLGRYLDLDEHLDLGVAIAWYPGSPITSPGRRCGTS
jgi:2,3-dimethylmalate lyase